MKLGTIAVLALLALGLSGLVPGMAGAGRENSLVQRVEELEGLVADLAARVEELEAGGGTCCSCSVLHLTPLADFPEEPSEGDVCVIVSDSGIEDWWSYDLWSYLDGYWWRLTLDRPEPIPPIPGPPVDPIPIP